MAESPYKLPQLNFNLISKNRPNAHEKSESTIKFETQSSIKSSKKLLKTQSTADKRFGRSSKILKGPSAVIEKKPKESPKEEKKVRMASIESEQQSVESVEKVRISLRKHKSVVTRNTKGSEPSSRMASETS